MTPEALTQLYDKVDQMVVTLAADPSVLGPLGLQRQISQIRSHLNDLGVMLQGVAREKYEVARRLILEKTAYEAEADKLLTEDELVRRLPSQADKAAKIRCLLPQKSASIHDLELQLSDLEFIEKTLKFRQQELQDTMSAVRLQRSLLEVDGKTGGFYGAEGDNSGGSSKGAPVDEDEVTFAEILAHLNAAAAEEAGDEAPEEEDLGWLSNDSPAKAESGQEPGLQSQEVGEPDDLLAGFLEE